MEKRRYSPQLELLEWSTPFCPVKLLFFFSNASIRLLTKLACVASAGKFQATTKPMVTSEPAVPSALLLGLNPSNMPRMLNKDLTRSRRVFSSVPKPSKRRNGSAGRVNNNGASAGGGAGGGPGPRHLLKNKQINVSAVEPRYYEGPREWQNMFITKKFVNLYRSSLSYCLTVRMTIFTF